MPEALAMHRLPKTKAAATVGALALIADIKAGGDAPVIKVDITVGAWLEKFTSVEASPRAARNVSRNRPNSVATIADYESYYRLHIKDDDFTAFKMEGTDSDDALLFLGRLGSKQLHSKRTMAGTRTYEAVTKFVRMAFREYSKTHRRWTNPFQNLDPPQGISHKSPDALTDDEVAKLFAPNVLVDSMERGVCAAMFLSGMRRAEIFALKPEDLDYKDRVIGSTKSKRPRETPFDPVLQEAIRKLREENGKYDFVFRFRDGKMPTAHWWSNHFHQRLERAGIDKGGRNLVPHSARHSLASMLEARGVPLRYIQELLGHSDLQTTKVYLHETADTIGIISAKIGEVTGQS
jgi:integrase/recombinase XerD